MAEKSITALSIRRGKAEWTSQREKKGVLEIAEQCEVSLELPESITDLTAPEGTAAIKAKCGALHGPLTVALPTGQVLMRVVQLPTVDPEEIRSMAELQVDKFSPFPVDHMQVGLETLWQSETASRVLIAAAQRERVDKLGETFTKPGLYPNAVDVEALAWWRLLKDEGAVAEKGRQAILIIDAAAAELIMVQDAVPVMFRSLGAHGHLEAGEAAGEIADEINYTLTAMEAEWGILDTDVLDVWRWQDWPSAFLTKLSELCAIRTEGHLLDGLPPLSEGLARRAGDRREGRALDLAPAEWHVATTARQTRKILLVAGSSLAGAWLLAFLGFFVALQLQLGRVSRIKAEAQRLAAPARQVEALKAQSEALLKYGSRSDSALECLREVSASLPAGIDVTTFLYKKYNSVSLRGEADSSDPIYDLFKKLEGAGIFTNVAPEGVTDENRGNRRRSVFKVTCGLPEAPS